MIEAIVIAIVTLVFAASCGVAAYRNAEEFRMERDGYELYNGAWRKK